MVALTDINKNLHATYAYGPFGEKIYATGDKATSNPWRWATKYLDEETGLYYFGHRFYDPITGHWLSREPLGESESVNLYAYCGNDPVNYVDVHGLARIAVNADGMPTDIGKILISMMKQGSASEAILLLYELQLQSELGRLGDGLVADPTKAKGEAFSDTDLWLKTLQATSRAGLDTRGDLRDLLKVGAWGLFDSDLIYDLIPKSLDMKAADAFYADFRPITNYGAEMEKWEIVGSQYRRSRLWSFDGVMTRASYGIYQSAPFVAEVDTLLLGNTRHLDSQTSTVQTHDASVGDRGLAAVFVVPWTKPLKPLAKAGKATGAFNPGSRVIGDGLGDLAGREVRVSQKGLNLVENHLAQFGHVEQNVMMIQRLRSALADGRKVSGADASFYLHEAAEATMMKRGMGYYPAHDAALLRYNVSPYSVYHPNVIRSLPDEFNSNWRAFWGIE